MLINFGVTDSFNNQMKTKNSYCPTPVHIHKIVLRISRRLGTIWNPGEEFTSKGTKVNSFSNHLLGPYFVLKNALDTEDTRELGAAPTLVVVIHTLSKIRVSPNHRYDFICLHGNK